MSTVHREQGFRFFVYPNDHEPAHVHVQKAQDWAKIQVSGDELELLEVSRKMKAKDINKMLDIAEEHHKKLLTGWEEIHGST
ncbi:DUF4160 domain-containing protein [Okeania sp. SIO2G5]|uniref:DUF4160 domain-containing protein n=1 Tax=Okeania sp. SIO2G5 TaxID=2607796 RepID=UPI0013C16FE3|nr:DUF4160 domain-containing protein [Okeania sp. SIO2G5]